MRDDIIGEIDRYAVGTSAHPCHAGLPGVWLDHTLGEVQPHGDNMMQRL